MHWQKIGLHQGRKTASLKFGLLDYFFYYFHQWGLHLFLRRKNKNYRTRNASQSQGGGFLEDFFAVCPETWVALDTANLITFFAEVWQNCTNFFLAQPGPSMAVKAFVIRVPKD